MAQRDVFKEIEAAVRGRATESAQRNAVAKVLGKYGYFKAPEIAQTRASDGVTVRIYTFHGSPAGDFALVAGPSLEGEVHRLSDMAASKAPKGLYIEAAPLPAKVEKREEKQITDAMKRAAAATLESRRVRDDVEERVLPAVSRQREARARLQGSGRVQVFETPKGSSWKRNPRMDWEAEEAGMDSGMYEYVGLPKAEAPAAPAAPAPAAPVGFAQQDAEKRAMINEINTIAAKWPWAAEDLALNESSAMLYWSIADVRDRLREAKKVAADAAAWDKKAAEIDARSAKTPAAYEEHLAREKELDTSDTAFIKETPEEYKARMKRMQPKRTKRQREAAEERERFDQVTAQAQDWYENGNASRGYSWTDNEGHGHVVEVAIGALPTSKLQAFLGHAQRMEDAAKKAGNTGAVGAWRSMGAGAGDFLDARLDAIRAQNSNAISLVSWAHEVHQADNAIKALNTATRLIQEINDLGVEAAQVALDDFHPRLEEYAAVSGRSDDWVQSWRSASDVAHDLRERGELSPRTRSNLGLPRVLPTADPQEVRAKDAARSKMTEAAARQAGADAFTRGQGEDDYPVEVEYAGQEAAYRAGWWAAQENWSEAMRTLEAAVPAWNDWNPEPIENERDYDRVYDSLMDRLNDDGVGAALRVLDQFRLGDAHAKKLLSAGEIAIRNLTSEGSGVSFRNLIDRLHEHFEQAERASTERYANAVNETLAEIRHKAEIGGVRADKAREALDIIDEIGMAGFIESKHPDFELYDFSDFGALDLDALERDALKSTVLLPYNRELDYIRNLLAGEYAAATRPPSKAQVQAFAPPSEPDEPNGPLVDAIKEAAKREGLRVRDNWSTSGVATVEFFDAKGSVGQVDVAPDGTTTPYGKAVTDARSATKVRRVLEQAEPPPHAPPAVDDAAMMAQFEKLLRAALKG